MARPLSSLFALLLGLGCGNQSSSDHNANIGAGSTAGSSSEGANPEGSTVASSSGDRVIDTPEGCDPYVDTPGATALYRLASAQGADGTKTHFFDSPWPAVERSLSEISKLPNPVSADGCELAANRDLATLLSGSFTAPEYRKYLYDLASSRLQKGANHPVMYIQFSEALDTAQLPSPLESLSAESPVFLMNVDEASPQRGALTPVRSRIYTGSRYLPPNTLASTPAVGFPLLSNTRYALVVRTSLGRSDSSPLGQAAELQALIGSDQCDGTSSAHASAAQYLTNAHGIAPQSLAALTVFDTGDPGGTLAQVRAAIRSVPDPNSIGKIQTPNAATTSGSELYVLNGNFQSLIQQVGAPPYLPTLTPDVATQSLRITLDSEDQQGRFLPGGIADGSVVTDNSAPRTEQLPFVLTLPSAAIQEQTVRTPLVVFGPGTGGSRLSPLDSGISAQLANLGYATLTVDPAMHVERSHSENIDSNLMNQLAFFDQVLNTTYSAQMTQMVESGDLFFNPFQLEAARGNVLQGAVDYLWQAKLFASSTLTATVAGEMRSISFESVSFFGHSQGGSLGPLLAGSESITTSVLSGAGGHIPSVLLNKTKPDDRIGIASMLQFIVCDAPSEPLDTLHPVLSIVGHWFEEADGEHYARSLLEDSNALSLFIMQGIGDNFSPTAGNEALTTAARLVESTAAPSISPPPVDGQRLLDQLSPNSGHASPVDAVSANVRGRTGGFKRYSGEGCDDPHFVYVCNANARSDWQSFFASALQGAPVIP